jgi:hypothetical protein
LPNSVYAVRVKSSLPRWVVRVHCVVVGSFGEVDQILLNGGVRGAGDVALRQWMTCPFWDMSLPLVVRSR